MARDDVDPLRLSSPRSHLWWMVIFLVIVGFIALILYRPLVAAFVANPGLNSVIVGVLVIGVVLAVTQVLRLIPEVAWINAFRAGEPGIEMAAPPRLIGPMAALLRDRRARMVLAPETMRSILDSIGMRLDEARDLTRYVAGLLVFLGLLGTFWGLTQTVGSVGGVIQSLNAANNDLSVLFEDLKTGLAAPLSGMGTAFSSSLLGLSGSLIVGFLDLQASQAQNRFYKELEDWLSAMTVAAPVHGPQELLPPREPAALPAATPVIDTSRMEAIVQRLARMIAEQQGHGGLDPELFDRLEDSILRLSKVIGEQGGARATTTAMANLAEGIQGLVQHMRSEQQMIRNWVEAQAEQQREIRRLLERLAGAVDEPAGE